MIDFISKKERVNFMKEHKKRKNRINEFLWLISLFLIINIIILQTLTKVGN